MMPVPRPQKGIIAEKLYIERPIEIPREALQTAWSAMLESIQSQPLTTCKTDAEHAVIDAVTWDSKPHSIAMCAFQVTMFSEEPRLIVEIRRQSGDHYMFGQIFRKLKSIATQSPIKTIPPLEREQDEEEEDNLSDQLVQILDDMIMSDFLDVKVSGASAILLLKNALHRLPNFHDAIVKFLQPAYNPQSIYAGVKLMAEWKLETASKDIPADWKASIQDVLAQTEACKDDIKWDWPRQCLQSL